MTLKDGFPHLLANSWRSKPHKPAWMPQGLKVNCSFEAPGWRRHDLLALWDVYGMFFRVFSCETHVIFVCIYDNASFSSNIVLYFQAILRTHRTWFNYWSTVNLSFFFTYVHIVFTIIFDLPSGNLLHSYWTWLFIVDFPINSMVFFQFATLNYQRVSISRDFFSDCI